MGTTMSDLALRTGYYGYGYPYAGAYGGYGAYGYGGYGSAYSRYGYGYPYGAGAYSRYGYGYPYSGAYSGLYSGAYSGLYGSAYAGYGLDTEVPTVGMAMDTHTLVPMLDMVDTVASMVLDMVAMDGMAMDTHTRHLSNTTAP